MKMSLDRFRDSLSLHAFVSRKAHAMATSSTRLGFMKWVFAQCHQMSEKYWARKVADAVTTADLWRLAKRRVPNIAFEYFRGGADCEIALVESVLAYMEQRTTVYGAVKFEGDLDFSASAFGLDLKLPFFMSPVGSLRTLWPVADAVASKVAGDFGTMMSLSTLSGTAMEEVTEASSGPCAFQLYLCGGREASIQRIQRAKAAGFKVLFLTVDTALAGNRAAHARMKPMEVMKALSGYDWQNFKLACKKGMLAPQMLPRLSWLTSHWFDGGLYEFVNIIIDGKPMPYTDIGKQLAASAVTWDDFTWIREAWGNGPIVIKGVHNLKDARKAEEIGAAGIIISNHGGRQQDRVPPTLHMLADIAPHMKDSKMTIAVDGGIRSGMDVFIALCYGAHAVGMGRVLAAGMAAGGEAGTRRALKIVKDELDRAMRLAGVGSVRELRQRGHEFLVENRIAGNAHYPAIVF